MGLPLFFRSFFPIAREEDLLEELFALVYCVKGMTGEYIESMSTHDRIWHLERLEKQLKAEAAELKKATKKR